MLLFACDAGGDGDWSRLRDTLARTPADPMALTLAAALERAPADDPREVADAGTQTDGLAALRTFDRARARWP